MKNLVMFAIVVTIVLFHCEEANAQTENEQITQYSLLQQRAAQLDAQFMQMRQVGETDEEIWVYGGRSTKGMQAAMKFLEHIVNPIRDGRADTPKLKTAKAQALLTLLELDISSNYYVYVNTIYGLGDIINYYSHVPNQSGFNTVMEKAVMLAQKNIDRYESEIFLKTVVKATPVVPDFYKRAREILADKKNATN